VKNEIGLPKAYAGILTYKEKPDFDDYAFTAATARAVFDMLETAVSKCLFIFLLVTGCRIEEALSVRLWEITWDYKLPDGTPGPVRVRFDGSYTKNGKSRIAFLTKEAAQLIRDLWTEKEYSRMVRRPPAPRRLEQHNGRMWYLLNARNKNKGLIAYSGNTPGVRSGIEAEDRLFPFSQSVGEKMLITMIRRAGFTERTKTGINKLHIHSTRKFFRTQFGQAAGQDAAETIMGHSPGLTGVYRHVEEVPLAQSFMKHEAVLKIFRDKDTEIVKERVDQQADRLLALERENERLKHTLDAVPEMERKMAALTKSVNLMMQTQAQKV